MVLAVLESRLRTDRRLADIQEEICRRAVWRWRWAILELKLRGRKEKKS